jgi:hypothetical protein
MALPHGRDAQEPYRSFSAVAGPGGQDTDELVAAAEPDGRAPSPAGAANQGAGGAAAGHKYIYCPGPPGAFKRPQRFPQ